MSARMQLFGDVVDDVIARLERQIYGPNSSKRIDPHRVPNDPRQEWMFRALLGKSRAEQKTFVLQARHPSVGFLTDADADTLISALGLENA